MQYILEFKSLLLHCGDHSTKFVLAQGMYAKLCCQDLPTLGCVISICQQIG